MHSAITKAPAYPHGWAISLDQKTADMYVYVKRCAIKKPPEQRETSYRTLPEDEWPSRWLESNKRYNVNNQL